MSASWPQPSVGFWRSEAVPQRVGELRELSAGFGRLLVLQTLTNEVAARQNYVSGDHFANAIFGDFTLAEVPDVSE